MLTSADEYPFHQTADPIAFAGTDRNFYDRFFFNGYLPDQSVFFAIAFGVYPQLDIMDTSVCILKDGKQHVLRASRHMGGDRAVIEAGPVSIEILQPMQSSRILIAENESGMKADLTFVARHEAIEEPRFTRRIGTRSFMDYTRATQNVSWRGILSVSGEEMLVSPDTCHGTRDRSWGVRPVGAPDPQPPAMRTLPQFFWLWTPANFDNHVAFSHTNDDAYGRPWNRRAVVQPLGADPIEFEDVRYEYRWRKGTRLLDEVTCHMVGEAGDAVLHYVMGESFYMSGLGYTHPEWGHGTDHGPLAISHEVIDLAQVAQSAQSASGNPLYMHIQGLAQVTLTFAGEVHQGAGVVEQLFMGRHDLEGLGEGLAPPASAV